MSNNKKRETRNTWAWVPSLYFAEGIPYVLVMTLSVIFYKRMGISNTDIALYTSWLYLPWIIKPLWSPIVDILKTKRWWIVLMQLFIGVGLAGVAFTIPLPSFFQYTLAFFWLLAFSSATHDIAADGFYMLGLSKHNQAYYIGIRSTFYRLAMLTGQGLLVILAGYFETSTGLPVVEINVNAETKQIVQEFNPDSIEIKSDSESFYFISNTDVEISTNPITKEEYTKKLDAVNQWNINHGFYKDELKTTNSKEENSWWQNNISNPLANSLKNTFNAEKADNSLNTTGNIGFTYFHLSHKPENNEKVILDISHYKGDKSISLVKGYRFEFTESNWNTPAFVVFQLDSKLNKTTSATFTTRSGNITFAWTMVFGFIAVVFLIFFIYHRFILPYPAIDKPNIKEGDNIFKEFIKTFSAFFRKKNIGVILTFLLVYRLGESQLVKLASPFLLDSRELDGLGLTTGDLGLIYGTIGIIML